MKMREIIVGSVAVLTAAAIALTAGPLKADPPPAARQTRQQKIAELTADLGYGDDIKHVDAAIPYLARNVAPTDPAWNSTHRRWAAVCAMIKPNLRDDAERAFAETEASIVENAEHALNDGAVGGDLDGALAFFRSVPGRHYLELQNVLTDMSIGISLDSDAPATGVSVENLDARKRLLELWLPIVFVRAIYPPQIADRSLDASYEKFSKLRGAQLDALAQRYADELPQFEAFIQTASFGRIINAEKLAGQATPAPNLSDFFAAEARRHASEWHAAYLAP